MSKCRVCKRPSFSDGLCRYHLGIALKKKGKGKANSKAALARLHQRETYRP